MVDTPRKAPGIVIEQIRAAILDEMYKPGERLMETDVATKFEVSRSPVREALQALESEGTLLAAPYSGALVGLSHRQSSTKSPRSDSLSSP